MTHVTYLLGAGASAQSKLPINKDLIKALESIVYESQFIKDSIDGDRYTKTIQSTYSKVIQDAKKEKSIDTLANIHFGNNNYLHDIKSLLWIYFSANAGKDELDPRYKHLLLRFRDKVSKTFKLRDDFSVLTWNYDLQLEEAYASIAGLELWKTPLHLKSYPGLYFLKKDTFNDNIDSKQVQLIHLNGCAGYYYDSEIRDYKNWYNSDLTNPQEYCNMARLVGQKFHTNAPSKTAIHNCINFAGEENQLNETKKDLVKLISKKTTHLVIIGYSFQDFNENMDTFIIENMENLRYIMIQDKYPEKIEELLRNKYPVLHSKI
ncbi:MAG: hypothetical protein B7Y76_09395, partial [Sphingobacteriia bacterium 35-40-5]